MAAEPRLLSLPMTAAYFRLIVRRFGTTRARRAALVAGTRVREEVDEISVRAQLRQLTNLARLAPADWGLEVGAALDGAAHGPAGAAIVTAATLGDALDVLVRYATVRAPFIDLRATRSRLRYGIEIVEPVPLGAVRTAMLEMVLLSTQWVVESALGRPMKEAKFTLPEPRPPHARRYTRFFHAPVTFAGTHASVSLPAAWLRLPCPLADPAVHRSARLRLEAMRERQAGEFADAEVERMLDAGDDAGAPMREIAARLRVSPRTLVRKLGRRGVSYRRIRDGHRRRRAVELLGRGDLSIAEIADRLGYEEPTNFARACRRWFGRSPRALRLTPPAR